jgi:hypothetical protein
MSRLKWLMPLAIFALYCVWLAYGVATANRRADLTDPAEIAKLPAGSLHDAEIECLVRAAFKTAEEVRIEGEGIPWITIDDPLVLDKLAKEFAVGRDLERLPVYRNPRPQKRAGGGTLEYSRIVFDQPDSPEIVFTGLQEITLRYGPGQQHRRHSIPLRNRFCKTLCDLLGLEPVSH